MDKKAEVLPFDDLRKEAERVLGDQPHSMGGMRPEEVHHLLGEMLRWQIKLEEKNKELNFQLSKHEHLDDQLQREQVESAQQDELLSALTDCSGAVMQHQNFETAARSIFESCKRLIGATAGYVALLSGDSSENEVLFLDTGGIICTVDPALPMPVRGLREEVYRTRKTISENNFLNSKWVELLPAGHVGIDNVIFAPLVVNGKTVGLLGLANKPGGFSAYDVQMASVFGELAAIALLNSQALEELENSEEQFRSVTETASDAIITIDKRGIIVFWNKAAETIFGYSQEEAIGKSLDIIMPECFRKDHEDGVSRVVNNNEARIIGKTVELTGLRKDGTEFPLELSLSSWKSKGEIFFSAVIRDITERVNAEALLTNQNEFIMNVFESLSHPFYVIDASNYTILMANSTAKAGGIPESTTCYNLLHKQENSCSAAGDFCPLDEVIKTKKKVVTEHIHSDDRGNSTAYEVHAYPIFNDQGDVSQMIEYTLDITERKQIEAALQDRSHTLSERIKELNCLFSISALVEKPDISLEEILQGTVEAIPPAWQYPKIAGARIILRDQEFRTENFSEHNTWQQIADVQVHGQRVGSIQVCYLDERASSDEGPFLKEERNLINAIASRLGRIVERMEAVEALRQAHHELELRVQERTAELEAANQMLQSEIIERKRAYQAEQNARQIAETMRSASQALTLSLEMDTVLDTLLDYLERLVPFDSANIAILGDETCLDVRAVRGYKSGPDAELILSQSYHIENNPQIQEILTTGRSVLIPDLHQSPDWKTYLELGQAGSWLGVPLVAEDKIIGLCGLDKGDSGFFSQEHLHLAETLIGQATVAIQNAWLFEQVRAGRERLQSLSRRLVEAQESERRYIARELHDETGQALTSLKVGLHLLEREANQPEAVIAGVAELKLMAEGILENLHRLAMDLRPASLEHLGLVAALRQYVEAISDKHKLTIRFEATGFNDRLPHEIETALYRIVQEGMTNIIRHAQATRADVILERCEDKIIMIVEDNGVGIDPLLVGIDNRLGIVGMRERAEMLGGKLTIERTAGAGTTLLVEVPYGDSGAHSG